MPTRSIDEMAAELVHLQGALAAKEAQAAGHGSGATSNRLTFLEALKVEARRAHTRVLQWAARDENVYNSVS